MAMAEISEAARVITEHIDHEAKVIFGAVIDDHLKKGEIKITVVATGFANGPVGSVRPAVPPTMNLFEIAPKALPQRPERPPEPEVKELVDSSVDDQVEFDIPAFIRRKMK